MDYLDIDIEIGAADGQEYPVIVINSAAGEARETMHFPFDGLALQNQLLTIQNALLRSGGNRRQILLAEEQAMQNFGRALFNALFTGEVRSRYVVSQREATLQGKGLRLKLRFLSPELAALPWEFLYDPAQAEYICLSNYTPIVRYLELPQPPRSLTVTPPLSILGMVSSPGDVVDLDINREKQHVEQATEYLQTNGLVKLTWLEGRTWQDLQRAMRHGPWHIFHFIGHGGFNAQADEGFIALENVEGGAHLLSASHLGRLLADHRSLRLVVLNSSEGARGSELDIFSSTATMLVRRGIPAVLALQYAITDRAAIELSRAFYEALGDGAPVDTAVSEARKAISVGIANSVEWGAPVLYMRSPDGVIFDLVQKPSGQQESPEPPVVNVSSNPSLFPARPSEEEKSDQPVVSQDSIRNFFISYNKADRNWAEWIAWQLEGVGYSTILQAWDFRPGNNFVLAMHKASTEVEQTLAVLSPDYLQSLFTQSEWAAAFAQDPTGTQGKLLPVRVRNCQLSGLLASIIYIDLVGLDEPIAREKLLAGVHPGRGKPASPPAFPEMNLRSLAKKPIFPGEDR